MLKSFLFGLLLLGLSSNSLAQTVDSLANITGKHKYLLLSSTNSAKRYRLYENEEISFQLMHNKTRFTGQIQAIRSNSFIFQNTEIPLEKVTSIRLQNHTGGRKAVNFLGYTLQSAGTLFTLIGAVNVVTNLNDKPDRKEGFITMGASIVSFAAGKSLRKLKYQTYFLGEKWKLRIMEMY